MMKTNLDDDKRTARPLLKLRPASEMILTAADTNLFLGSGELLGCPFCGGKAMSGGELVPNGTAYRWTIRCTKTAPGSSIIPDCFANVIGVDKDQAKARAAAVERWNRRQGLVWQVPGEDSPAVTGKYLVELHDGSHTMVRVEEGFDEYEDGGCAARSEWRAWAEVPGSGKE